ncbi:hypothetical protein PTKIN_Ptkin15bG0181900 [Pterospermum kingtungense]
MAQESTTPPPPPSKVMVPPPPLPSGIRSHSLQGLLSQNYANWERSTTPSQFLYFGNNRWINFSAHVAQTLQTGFMERKPIIQASIRGVEYMFDLKKMLVIDCVTGSSRSICWVDETSNCFVPKDLVCEDGFTEPDISEPDINRNPNIGGSSLKRKRADIWPNMRLLDPTDEEYVVIKDNFLFGMKKVDVEVCIRSIHRLIDKTRIQNFQNQSKITKSTRGSSNIVHGWYGASEEDVKSILANGFGLPSNIPPTDVYGIGVYLSPLRLPHLSVKLADSDDNGIKHIVFCRVVLGNVEKVEVGSQQDHPSSADFDSGSDDPENPKWFVIWSDKANSHIVPECVVSFKISGDIDQPRIGDEHPLEELLLKIQDLVSLPSSKVQELWDLNNSFKNGSLTEEELLKKLKEIAGDDVLLSAMRDIIGFN